MFIYIYIHRTGYNNMVHFIWLLYDFLTEQVNFIIGLYRIFYMIFGRAGKFYMAVQKFLYDGTGTFYMLLYGYYRGFYMNF